MTTSNKAASIAIQARIELETRLSIIRGGVAKEVDTLNGDIEVQGAWGSNCYSKHKYFNVDEEGSNLDGGWWGGGRLARSYSQSKTKAKWDRSGKASRRAANRA